jgi:drug/metabolite transporter (DMT)-like permease
VPAGALALALAAALVHAVWNLLLARADDTEAATAVALGVSVVLFAVPAALLWEVDARAWPYIAGSTAFEVGYVATLAGALRRGDLSVVYPLARGSAPVLVLAVSAGVLGAATSVWQVTGVALVAAGVVLVRGLSRPDDRGAVLLAFACGACIAGYTVVDSHGLDHAAALPYLWVVMALTALVYVPWVARARGGAALRGALRADTAVAAVLFFGAYLLVLAALRLAEPGPVAAVRETSVVLATALGALILRERVTPARAAGAVVVVAGAALIALS